MKHKQSLGWHEEGKAGPMACSRWRRYDRLRVPVGVVITLLATATGWANGGPFVIKYPGGDPAAKGVLARLDPDLKPARETRLQVVKEDLTIDFAQGQPGFRAAKADAETPPLVSVTAAYLITNPTPEAVEVDFGFPILRGIYQVAYMVHPASRWDSFGPIHLAVTAPEGVTPVSTQPLRWLADSTRPISPDGVPAAKLAFKTYSTLLTEKTGELFVGINAEDWRKAVAPREISAAAVLGKPDNRK